MMHRYLRVYSKILLHTSIHRFATLRTNEISLFMAFVVSLSNPFEQSSKIVGQALIFGTTMLITTMSQCTHVLPSDLVDITQIIPDVVLDIRYATTNNFTGVIIYDQARCFLRRSTAEKLKAAHNEFKTLGLKLKVFDGYRPYSAQFKLYDAAPDKRYVGNPYKGGRGSKHNRGAAIDCTLVDSNGNELHMPSGFDELSLKAHRDYATMDSVAARNCKLFETIMLKHGFEPLPHEWWHYNDTDWQHFEVADLSFDELDKQNTL